MTASLSGLNDKKRRQARSIYAIMLLPYFGGTPDPDASAGVPMAN